MNTIRDAAGNMDYVSKAYWVDDGGSQASATATYAYDAAGCLTNLNGTSLEWDERYRLKEVKIANGTNLAKSVSYEYDVLGRRVFRVEDGVTNFFIYDGNQVVADLDGNGNLLRSYVWGPGIDNLLSMTVYTNGGSQASATYYAIKDHQNTVLALADASGAVVESYEYDAYGNTTILDASGLECSESSIGNRYMFQGCEYDSSTGLYYFRARWYDSDSGRWLSKDPIGIEGGLNQYVFCDNDPVNRTDPMGLFWLKQALSTVGLVAAAAVVAAGSVAAAPLAAAVVVTAAVFNVGITLAENTTISMVDGSVSLDLDATDMAGIALDAAGGIPGANAMTALPAAATLYAHSTLLNAAPYIPIGGNCGKKE